MILFIEKYHYVVSLIGNLIHNMLIKSIILRMRLSKKILKLLSETVQRGVESLFEESEDKCHWKRHRSGGSRVGEKWNFQFDG